MLLHLRKHEMQVEKITEISFIVNPSLPDKTVVPASKTSATFVTLHQEESTGAKLYHYDARIVDTRDTQEACLQRRDRLQAGDCFLEMHIFRFPDSLACDTIKYVVFLWNHLN